MYDPANRRLGTREADSSLMMFGFYIWNNIRIGFQTFAGGLLFGVGSIWFLGANGVVIGAVAGYLTQIGYSETFWSFVAGHSSLELTAIAIAGAAGLRLGMAVIAPGNVSRRAALVAAARPAVRLMYGAAAMFLGAAFVEAFWSPLTEIDFQIKILVGIAGWAILLAYFPAGRARSCNPLTSPSRCAGARRGRRWTSASPCCSAGGARRTCRTSPSAASPRSPAGASACCWARRVAALLFVWWLKPLYDRVVLHVLSRAVFGEVQSPRHVLGAWREWLAPGSPWRSPSAASTPRARSTCRCGSSRASARGAARERRSVLGRRVSSYATWLTIVCVHFELVLYWSLGQLTSLFVPAKSLEGRDFTAAFLAGDLFHYGDLLAYVAAVLLLEPFYVAAGFALYLNRRTLLEGWDIEVALRKITQRHAATAMLLVCCMIPLICFSAEKDPKQQIAEVLKAPEFPHQVDEQMRWQRRHPEAPEQRADGDVSWLLSLGQALADAARVLFWAAAGRGSSPMRCGGWFACCRARARRPATPIARPHPCSAWRSRPTSCRPTSARRQRRWRTPAGCARRSACSIAARCRTWCTAAASSCSPATPSSRRCSSRRSASIPTAAPTCRRWCGSGASAPTRAARRAGPRSSTSPRATA
jgi:uncharacterized membrane protein SpoIIM required for sporulation